MKTHFRFTSVFLVYVVSATLSSHVVADFDDQIASEGTSTYDNFVLVGVDRTLFDTEFADSARATTRQVLWTHFLTPVDEAQPLPKSVLPYYKRYPLFSAGIAEYKARELNQVRGGRVLNSIDAQSHFLNLKVSRPDSPAWFQVTMFSQDEGELRFSDGNRVFISEDSDMLYSVGYFLSDYQTLELAYTDIESDERRYELGWRQLFGPEKFGHVEGYFSFSRYERDESDDTIVSSTIRILGSPKSYQNTWRVGLSYFPHLALQFGGYYERVDFDFGGLEVSNYLFWRYDFESGVVLSSDFRYTVPDSSAERGALRTKNKAIGLAVGLKF